MKANTKLFVVAGLLVALGLALFVSPLADSDPDGLTKVAEDEGFAEAEQEHDLADSPVAGYEVDGVDEARAEDGSFFGRTRLAEFAAREASSGAATPEVMRRLHQAILRYQTGRLQDDATTLFVEWLTGNAQELAL